MQELKTCADFLDTMDGMSMIQQYVDMGRSTQAEVVGAGAKQCKMLVMEAFLLTAFRNAQNAETDQDKQQRTKDLRQLCLQEQLFLASNSLDVNESDLHPALKELIAEQTS